MYFSSSSEEHVYRERKDGLGFFEGRCQVDASSWLHANLNSRPSALPPWHWSCIWFNAFLCLKKPCWALSRSVNRQVHIPSGLIWRSQVVRGGFLSGPGISPVYDQASSAVDGVPSPSIQPLHEFFLGLREEIGLCTTPPSIDPDGKGGGRKVEEVTVRPPPRRTTLLSRWSTSARLLRKGN
ncbi:hypothetical protein AVEN_267805-1 [Araneus ventricosus]|uniref:Uncharacterized protein n=1 Tax=Araneus ventricosus TaxID=182803 RepID=A0A4Y2D3C6_ARAVE|nr:hypothetical protein AVEN_267805-1 [Araneus ventricosus]